MSNRTPISKRLKEARQMKGISQKKLGISAGIDEFSASARMNQYETGKHIPDFLTLTRIAKVLKIPMPYFYTSDDILAEIIRNYGKLDKKQRQQLLEFIDQFLN
jgi:transcriptional regulator with XRE-family HTH domain